MCATSATQLCEPKFLSGPFFLHLFFIYFYFFYHLMSDLTVLDMPGELADPLRLSDSILETTMPFLKPKLTGTP
jgi:hypothetical protein